MNYAQKLGAANLADPNGTRKALPHDKQNKVMGENLCMATRYKGKILHSGRRVNSILITILRF